MFLFDLLGVPGNQLFVNDNRVSIYPGFVDYQLFYCCNDFPGNAPNTAAGVAQRLPTRHPFPTVDYLDGATLATTLPQQAGALPHDPLNRRWRDSTLSASFPAIDYGTPLANDTFDLDFDPANPPPPPLDSDSDGMPDRFEIANAGFGLNPDVNDANGGALSIAFTGIPGYTNLECYLNALADQLAGVGPVFANGFE
jgi:hypothetical protein